MKDLLKQIRTYMNLSQEEFADRLNIAFATVNRWENGRAEPNRLTQYAIYRLCTEEKVPVYEMIIGRINSLFSSVAESNGKRILFHGSKNGIQGNIAPLSRSQCDFGRGFYMGTNAEQALTLICDYELSKLYILSLDTTGLAEYEVNTGLDWALLVALNRGKMEGIRGSNLYTKYMKMTGNADLISGCIADDRMFYVLDNFFSGNITDAALIGSLSALNLGKQCVAVTDKACKAVKIEEELSFSYLERLFIRDRASQNRQNGVNLADKICRDYRREGLYFDEILEKSGEGGR